MTFTTARWANAEQTSLIAARADGATVSVPADAANADYRLITQGDAELGVAPLTIAPYQRWPDLATAKSELRSAAYHEASRRVDAITDDGEANPRRRREQLMMAAIVITRKEMKSITLTEDEVTTKAIAEFVEAAVYDIQVAEAVKKAEFDALSDIAAAEAYDVEEGWS